jgi:hypothetical protein
MWTRRFRSSRLKRSDTPDSGGDRRWFVLLINEMVSPGDADATQGWDHLDLRLFLTAGLRVVFTRLILWARLNHRFESVEQGNRASCAGQDRCADYGHRGTRPGKRSRVIVA